MALPLTSAHNLGSSSEAEKVKRLILKFRSGVDTLDAHNRHTLHRPHSRQEKRTLAINFGVSRML